MMEYNIVGTIYNNDAVYGDDGEVITPATPKEGFHVNALSPIDGADDYLVTPEHPTRRYAPPAETIFYRFPDEQTFREFVPEPDTDVAD